MGARKATGAPTRTFARLMLDNLVSESRVERGLGIIQQIILPLAQPAAHADRVAQLQMSIGCTLIPRPFGKTASVRIPRRRELNPVPADRVLQFRVARAIRPAHVAAEYKRDFTSVKGAECPASRCWYDVSGVVEVHVALPCLRHRARELAAARANPAVGVRFE